MIPAQIDVGFALAILSMVIAGVGIFIGLATLYNGRRSRELMVGEFQGIRELLERMDASTKQLLDRMDRKLDLILERRNG